MCMCRINLWLIFSETFAAAAGGGETCLMCNQRDVFLPAGSRPSVRRHMMHVLHLPNLRSLLTFPPAFFSQDGTPLSGQCGVLICKIFVLRCNVPGVVVVVVV